MSAAWVPPAETPPGPVTLDHAARCALLRARHYQLSDGPLILWQLSAPSGAEPPGQRALLYLIYCHVLSLQTRAGTGEAPGEHSLNRKQACIPVMRWVGVGGCPGRATLRRGSQARQSCTWAPHSPCLGTCLCFGGALACLMRTGPPTGVVMKTTEVHIKLRWALQTTGDWGLRSPWCPPLLRPPWQEPAGQGCSGSQDRLFLWNPWQRDNLWTGSQGERKWLIHQAGTQSWFGKKPSCIHFSLHRHKSLQFLSFGAMWMLQKKSSGDYPKHPGITLMNVGVDTVTPGEQGVLAAMLFISWFSRGRVNTGEGTCTYKGLPWPSR